MAVGEEYPEGKTYCLQCDSWEESASSCAKMHNTIPRMLYIIRQHDEPIGRSKLSEGAMSHFRRASGLGAARFDITGVISPTETVFYEKGVHRKNEVLEKWFELNRDRLERKEPQLRTITYHIPKDWEGVWKELYEDKRYDWIQNSMPAGAGNVDQGKTCPFCGEEVIALPDHLPCEESS